MRWEAERNPEQVSGQGSATGCFPQYWGSDHGMQKRQSLWVTERKRWNLLSIVPFKPCQSFVRRVLNPRPIFGAGAPEWSHTTARVGNREGREIAGGRKARDTELKHEEAAGPDHTCRYERGSGSAEKDRI